MTVQIEIDEQTLAEVDAAIETLRENREDVLRQAFRDLAKRKKHEAEVARMYAAAYGKNPIQPDEFEIEENQIIEVWND